MGRRKHPEGDRNLACFWNSKAKETAGEADIIEERGGGPLAQTRLSRVLWAQQSLLQLVSQ